MIPHLEKTFKIKIVWNYFATAHGKSCIDGIGNAVKKQVRTVVVSKERNVYQTEDFVSAFYTNDSKVNLMGMSQADMDDINSKLNLSEIYLKALAIPKIMSFHQLQVVDNRPKAFIVSKGGYQSFQ